jgi:hypothetical protein
MPNSRPPLFDAEHADLMQRGTSLTVAACGHDLRPSVARATGCRVAPDRRNVRVLISARQAAQVLAHVRETGALAAVFSVPSTYITLQLKGTDATVEAATTEDLEAVARYVEAFVAELDPLGYAPELIRTMLTCPKEDIVALSFTPAAAFTQTPGPGAGGKLKAGA